MDWHTPKKRNQERKRAVFRPQKDSSHKPMTAPIQNDGIIKQEKGNSKMSDLATMGIKKLTYSKFTLKKKIYSIYCGSKKQIIKKHQHVVEYHKL